MWCGSFVGPRGRDASAPTSDFAFERVAPEESDEYEDYVGAGEPEFTSLAAKWAYKSASGMHRLFQVLMAFITLHPGKTRAIIVCVFGIGIAGPMFMHPAHAQVLNTIETTVENATGGWLANALVIAKEIFMVLVGWLLMYNIVAYYMAFETVRGMFSVILRTLLNIGIPYLVLSWAPTTVGTVMGWALAIDGNIDTGGAAPPTTPDAVVKEGVQIGWGLLQNAFNAIQGSHFVFSLNPAQMGNDLGYDFTQGFVDLVFLVAAAVLCVVMIAAFTFIAVELVMAFLQAYFCLPLGAWTLGFMATPATSGIAMGWWRGLIMVGVRFIAILACVSFAQNIGLQWQADLANIVPNWNHLPQWNGAGQPPPVDIGALKIILSMALGAMALLYLVFNLPSLAASIVSGAPVLTGTNALQVAATPAMMGAGAAAGAALGGGAGAAKGAWMGWSQSMGGGSAVGLAGAARGAASGFAGAAGGGARSGAAAGARQARTMSNTVDKMRRG